MTRKHHGRCVRATKTLKAPAADVWRAWADPEQIAQWFVDRAEGTCKAGEVMTWMFDAFGMKLPVPIIEAEPGTRLVTGVEEAGVVGPLPVLMEIDIETRGGDSVLRLVNSGFSEDPSKDDEVEGVRSGWELALATLGYWLDRGKPMGRMHHISIRPTMTGWDPIASLYAGRDGLAKWLDGVRAPDVLAVGDRVSARLGGMPLSGNVLAHTGREVLIEWSEVGGVLGLKAFVMGPSRAIALDLSAWGNKSPEVSAAVEAAIERLASAAADFSIP